MLLRPSLSRDALRPRACAATCLAMALVPLACAPTPGPSSSPGEVRTGTPPRIDSLVPASAPAGEAYPVRLRIVGGPFLPEGNRVWFDGTPAGDAPSPDGRTLEVQLPKVRPSGGEAPPLVIPPGRYPVVVEVAGRRSAPAFFVLTEGRP